MNLLKQRLYDFFAHKRVLILGFGREGRSTLALLREIPCTIGIADQKKPTDTGLEDCELFFGASYLDAMEQFDIVMKAPGIPLYNLSEDVKRKITGQADLLMRFSPNPIIGITGTKGKSTTSTLIHYFLQSCGKQSVLAGNIGVPPLECASIEDESVILVIELSCHQLQFVQASPDTAVLLNLYPEHLDHYKDFAEYKAAKENIYLYQNANDVLIYNTQFDGEKLLASPCRKITLDYGKPADIWLDDANLYLKGLVIPRTQIQTRLCGAHNLYNVACALCCAIQYGCKLDELLVALSAFQGLEHRLERVCVIHGAEFINDSICTIPSAAVAAIKAFDKVDTIILGGLDRGIPYDELAEFLNTGIVKNIILIPQTGARIFSNLHNSNLAVFQEEDLEAAVKRAVEVTKVRCLLSPAAASYHVYQNFEERGKHYKQLLQRYL